MEYCCGKLGYNWSKWYYQNRKHLKQAELAELVDVSAQHISHVECGKTKLSLPVYK